MKDNNIQNIIEEKIKLFTNQWYDIWEYDIDELIIWFLEIWDSLFLTSKEELLEKDIENILTQLITNRFLLWQKWWYRFWEIIKDLKLDTINKKLSDEKIIRINEKLISSGKLILEAFDIKKEIDKHVKTIGTKESRMKIKDLTNKYPFNEMKKITISFINTLDQNSDILIEYISNTNWDSKEIVKYKNILKDYYQTISRFIINKRKLFEKLYKNWDIIFENSLDSILNNPNEYLLEKKEIEKSIKITNKLKKLKLNIK